MELTKILSQISSANIENAQEITTTLTKEFKTLTEEKKQITQELETTKTNLNSILESFGAEGENLESRLKTLGEKHKSTQAQLQEKEALLNETKKQINHLERKTLLKEIALKTGASSEVLETLLLDKPEAIAFKDEKILIGDQELVPFVEAKYKAFLPALFPSNRSGLPSGSANSKKPEDSPVKEWLKQKSIVPDYLKDLLPPS